MEEDKISVKCKALIIAGSAGSLEVILNLLPLLNSNFPFAIIIVLHRKNNSESLLSDLFAYKTNISVKEIEDKDPIVNGVIYLAPPDYHLLIENNCTFSLDDSEKINYSRPSIDVTFESAAEIFSKSLVCLLLSGANADGTKGLIFAKNNGAIVCIQDPETAEVPYMPEHAILNVKADYILKPSKMVDFINNL